MISLAHPLFDNPSDNTRVMSRLRLNIEVPQEHFSLKMKPFLEKPLCLPLKSEALTFFYSIVTF